MEHHLDQIKQNHRLSFDEPLDLSLPKKKRYHGKENGSCHVPVKRQKVMARLWQTKEVMWSEGSAQPFVSDSKPDGGETNGAPVMAITPECLPMVVKSSDGNEKMDHGLKDLISGELGKGSQPLKKRNRFSITQLFLLEKAFEMRIFPRPSETQGLARLLDVEEYRVKAWFQARRQKWKKENDWNKNIRTAALVQQSTLLFKELKTQSPTV